MSQNIINQINQLRLEVNKHNIAYHQKDNPIILDADFDKIRTQLTNLEEKYPELLGKCQKYAEIGSKALEKFGKITHTKPMLSLSNAFSAKDIEVIFFKIKNIYHFTVVFKEFVEIFHSWVQLKVVAIDDNTFVIFHWV